MSDRKSDRTPDRPFGPDASEPAHVDLRTGARAERTQETPDTRPAPAAQQPDLSTGEVMHGDRHAAAIDPANHGQAHQHTQAQAPASESGAAGAHTAYSPTGSARAGVETPTDGKSRKMLIAAAIAVVVILVVLMLIPGDADAATLRALWNG